MCQSVAATEPLVVVRAAMRSKGHLRRRAALTARVSLGSAALNYTTNLYGSAMSCLML